MPNCNLKLSDVCLTLGNRLILSNINHTFYSGSIILLVGKNGSGKSTLLETMSGLRPPDSGQIIAGNDPLWRGKKPDRSSLLRIGFVFQQPEEQLFAPTVREEFHYSLRPYKLPKDLMEIKAKSALVQAGAEAEWLDVSPHQLSGGQQRRLITALAASTDTDWLLMDEPTAGLDKPGVDHLLEMLLEWKRAGKGIVIATHDPGLFITHADHVVVMKERTIGWHGPIDQWSSGLALKEDCGLEASDSLLTLDLLRKQGVPLPAGWVDPRDAAMAIFQSIRSEDDALSRRQNKSPAVKDSRIDSLMVSEGKLTDPIPSTGRHWMNGRDPRALWIAYLFLSFGILAQNTWAGWAAGAMLTVAILRSSQTPTQVWLQPLKGMMIMIAIAVLVSGVTMTSSGRLSFLYDQALSTGYQLSRIAMIMLLGLSLLHGNSALRLKRALDQGLRPLQRFGLPVDRFALSAALIVRFIPLLQREWQRFALIAAARGKYPVRRGTVPLSQLGAAVLPFMLSLLRLGEQWSVALEAKGVGSQRRKPSRAYKLRWTRMDLMVVVVSLILFFVFMFLKK